MPNGDQPIWLAAGVCSPFVAVDRPFVALGHPFAATGARIPSQAVKELLDAT